jgi:hypothetical protein
VADGDVVGLIALFKDAVSAGIVLYVVESVLRVLPLSHCMSAQFPPSQQKNDTVGRITGTALQIDQTTYAKLFSLLRHVLMLFDGMRPEMLDTIQRSPRLPTLRRPRRARVGFSRFLSVQTTTRVCTTSCSTGTVQGHLACVLGRQTVCLSLLIS